MYVWCNCQSLVPLLEASCALGRANGLTQEYLWVKFLVPVVPGAVGATVVATTVVASEQGTTALPKSRKAVLLSDET